MGAGGTSEPIPIWDLSSLMGSIMLIGTVLMALWVPSLEVNLDQSDGLVELASIEAVPDCIPASVVSSASAILSVVTALDAILSAVTELLLMFAA